MQPLQACAWALCWSGEAVQVLVLRISRKRSSTSSERESITGAAETASSRLQQIDEARIGLQFLHPNIVHVYAYAARIINMDTIMAKVGPTTLQGGPALLRCVPALVLLLRCVPALPTCLHTARA